MKKETPSSYNYVVLSPSTACVPTAQGAQLTVALRSPLLSLSAIRFKYACCSSCVCDFSNS